MLASCFIALTFIEIALRLNDQKPFRSKVLFNNEPKFNNFHPKLGWFPKEGKYIFKENSKKYIKTILNDGSRKTNENEIKHKKSMIFIGGSFTQGQGVNDEDTFAYNIQNSLDEFKVYNFGVGGYGTYQSFLLLEDILKKKNNHKLIFYFFIEHHLIRNHGEAKWLGHLSEYAKRNHLFLPYARLSNDKLVRFEPIKYLNLPLSDRIVVINKLQKNFMEFKLRTADNEEKLIFYKILEQMNEISKKNNSEFIFVNLDSNKNLRKKIKNKLKNFKIAFFDCQLDLGSANFTLKDGHPNSSAHNFYSDCIYFNLKKNGYIN